MVLGLKEKLSERLIVRADCHGIDVFVGSVQPVTADAEDYSVNTSLVVKTPVCGAMLTKEIGAVTLAPHSLPESSHLRAVPVCVVRRVGVIDHWADARLAERRQVGGELLDTLAVQVRVLRGKSDVQPCFGQCRDLVASLVRSLNTGDVHGGPPGFLGGDRIGGQQAGQATLELDQGIVTLPLVRTVA